MISEKCVLILGASYGSLFASKLALAGHNATMVCLPDEQELITSEGIVVRLPVRGINEPVVVTSAQLTGKISATSTSKAIPGDYDLIVLAMQEPQYSAPSVRELLLKIAKSGVPCMSIMNMPPLPFLARIDGVDTDSLRGCYKDASVWDAFDPALMTLASPDPQAFRPPGEPVNVLQVGLPTNFKVARFQSQEHTDLLRQLQSDIENARFRYGEIDIELPVKLKVHDSVFVPLAKWLMLLTGNYRCIQKHDVRPIQAAVHDDIEMSESVYNFVGKLCLSLGADPSDLVPFEKYANAAKSLGKPSSAARALSAGAINIERLDKVVQLLAKGKGMQHDEVDVTVRNVDCWLEKNRSAELVT